MPKKLLLFLLICMSVLVYGCVNHPQSSSSNSASSSLFDINMKSIQWLNSAFSWELRDCAEERTSVSSDVWLEDNKLQEAIAGFEIVYPISTNEKLACYANQLCCVLRENTYFGSNTETTTNIIPKRAVHFANGIWCIEFGYNTAGVQLDGIVFEAIISETDGHIIYFYQRD